MIKEDRFLKKIADFCISKSKDFGSTSSNVLVMNTISENVNIRNKKLDGSERSENLGVTLTTYIGKKKASISSTNLSENNLFELVTRCIDSTKVTPEVNIILYQIKNYILKVRKIWSYMTIRT